MSYTAATESRLTKQQVSRLAEFVAEQLGYVPGGDLKRLIGQMGGSVNIEDTLLQDPETTGSLFVESDGRFRIIVPSHTSIERDRFTIAHELGHYVLHYLWARKNDQTAPSRIVAYRRGSDRIEWEANWFAAAFLMPEAEFQAAFDRLGRDLRAVAAEFGVSGAAASVRAKGLGLAE